MSGSTSYHHYPITGVSCRRDDGADVNSGSFCGVFVEAVVLRTVRGWKQFLYAAENAVALGWIKALDMFHFPFSETTFRRMT